MFGYGTANGQLQRFKNWMSTYLFEQNLLIARKNSIFEINLNTFCLRVMHKKRLKNNLISLIIFVCENI